MGGIWFGYSLLAGGNPLTGLADAIDGIVGHEISHALANHTAERMSRAMATTLGVIAIGVAADNHAAVTLWQKMGTRGGGKQPEFLSTHPAPGNREAALAALTPQMRQLNPQGTLAAVHQVEIVR